MIQGLDAWAERRGYRIAVGSEAAVGAAVQALRDLEAAGAFSARYFQENLSWIGSCAPEAAYTLVMVAMPLPAYTVTFHWQDRPTEAVIPVTYYGYRPTFDSVRDDLNQEFSARGTRFTVLRAPLKSVAARMGLVRYGCNNVTYCQGLGSYYQLVGLISETPLPGGAPEKIAEPEALPLCRTCRACQAACPSGAIGSSRFLLAADRCLTLLSESPGPLPPEIQRRKTPCLIGCLECQTCCPENKGKLKFSASGISFSAAETLEILRSESSNGGSLPPPLREKLGRLRMTELEEVVGRNLRVLLEGMPDGVSSA